MIEVQEGGPKTKYWWRWWAGLAQGLGTKWDILVGRILDKGQDWKWDPKKKGPKGWPALEDWAIFLWKELDLGLHSNKDMKQQLSALICCFLIFKGQLLSGGELN